MAPHDQVTAGQAFRQFQYLTAPLHVSGDFMNTALRQALSPAFDDGRPG